jgi:hypothetical protein
MALGTACIYLASVVALRPILKWRLARAGRTARLSAKKIRTSAVHN